MVRVEVRDHYPIKGGMGGIDKVRARSRRMRKCLKSMRTPRVGDDVFSLLTKKRERPALAEGGKRKNGRMIMQQRESGRASGGKKNRTLEFEGGRGS